MRTLAAAACATLAGCSPFSNSGFVCTDNAQCFSSGAAGVCQPDGRCSFADTTCSSGQRYGEQSGPLSGTCVGEQQPPPDTGSNSSGTDDAACILGGFDVCDLTASPALTINTNRTLDTGSDPLCHVRPQTGGPDICLVYTTAVSIAQGATLSVIGTRPLVLVASSTMTIAGTLDGSSYHNGPTGPNAGFGTGCAVKRGAEDDSGGAAGAAGGTFHGKAGDGGDGDTDNSKGLDGTAQRGQAADAIGAPTFARGGCAGGRGGDEGGIGGGKGGNGGSPGGAVWLIAGATIDVTGIVRATGAGGTGGDTQAGGGGGGSGGFLKLVATTLNLPGTIAANGGAGGEGGCRCNNVDVSGDPGTDGNASATPAPGGNKNQNVGGDGGASSSQGNLGGTVGADSIVGGGGGGGGAGHIVLQGTIASQGTISPPP